MSSSGELSELLYQNFRDVPRPITKLPSDNPPPFRTFEQFLKATVNTQHVGSINFSRRAYEEMQTAHEKWFYYHAIRVPNQFTGRIDFGGPNTYLSEGIKGGGKSAENDNIGARYRKVVTVHTARDDECLADCRMYEFRNDPRVPPAIQKNLEGMERVLIVGSDQVDIKSSFDYVPFTKLELNDIENHDVVVVPQRVHKTRRSFFQCSDKVVDLVAGRMPHSDKGEVFLKVLEAANIIYSRIAIKGARIEAAKAHLVYLVREMRHAGVALGMDTQYSTSMDLEVRTNSDYTFFKNMGSDKLPHDISWLYGWAHPTGLMSLYQNEFVCKDKWGGIYVGWFKLPPWHKTPKENIYNSLGIQLDWKAPEEQDFSVKPQEIEDVILHMEIVRAYENVKTFKGTERMLQQAGTPHDLKTIKKHVDSHFVAKSCSCWKTTASSS